MEKMEFLILTPMSEANLSKITLIARGDYMTVPSIMARPGVRWIVFFHQCLEWSSSNVFYGTN